MIKKQLDISPWKKQRLDFRGDIQVCHQRLSGAFDLLLIFLCSLIQTLTPPPNNVLLANMDMWGEILALNVKSILCLYSNTATPNPGACLLKVKPQHSRVGCSHVKLQLSCSVLLAGCGDAVVLYSSLSRYLLSPGMYPPKVCGPS